MRGVLAVTVDLDTATAASTSSFRGLAALLLGIVLVGCVGLAYFVVSTGNQARVQVEVNIELEAQKKEAEVRNARLRSYAIVIAGQTLRYAVGGHGPMCPGVRTQCDPTVRS